MTLTPDQLAQIQTHTNALLAKHGSTPLVSALQQILSEYDALQGTAPAVTDQAATIPEAGEE